jgi:translation initiation factor 2 alpha subunit (eIF-2alpha)
MINVGDVVLCKVTKIEGANVFVEVDGMGPGSIVLSEIAAGRIRNLREYVSPNRKIVCKVLKVSNDHLELSLRRVTAKERDGVLDGYKKERALTNMLKTVVDKPEQVTAKIKQEMGVVEFLDGASEDVKVIEKFIDKVKAKKLFQIISEKEEKERRIKRKFVLKSYSGEGLKEIKEILEVSEGDVKYIGSSVFSVSVSGKDFKEVEAKLDSILEEIEKRAEKKKVIFRIKKEK